MSKPLADTIGLDEPRVRVDCLLGGGHEGRLADDVLDGLTRPFKELSSKQFYDSRGAELFDRGARAATVGSKPRGLKRVRRGARAGGG